jgi:hypothetical protein
MRWLLWFFIAVLLCSTAKAQTYKCEFLQEKRPHGKTNAATCTASPEAIFSLGSYVPPRNELCDVSGQMGPATDDYVNFVADIDKKKVSYTEVISLPEYTWEQLAEYEARKDKIPLEEARKRIASEWAKPVQHQIEWPIWARLPSIQSDYFSKTTGALVKDPTHPKERFVQIIQYGMTGEYLLEVPKEGGPAAIIEYELFGRNSAVNMKFGNCTKTN